MTRVTISESRYNGNVQYHDQEESKSNSGVHTLTHDKIIKYPFNKNNIANIEKYGLSIIINRLSFNSSKNVLFSHVRIVKPP